MAAHVFSSDDQADLAWEAFLVSLRALETPDCPRLADIADAFGRHARRTGADWRRFIEEPPSDERLLWFIAVAQMIAARMRLLEPVFTELEPKLPTIREVAFWWFAEAAAAPERWREIDRRRPIDIVREWVATARAAAAAN